MLNDYFFMSSKDYSFALNCFFQTCYKTVQYLLHITGLTKSNLKLEKVERKKNDDSLRCYLEIK